MKLKDIVSFLELKIPKELALSSDNVGFQSDYDLSQDISSVKIFMDFYRCDDCFDRDVLVVTHHPPLFKPKSLTYTVHSNWDIIDGGANDALAECLDLKVKSYFDDDSGIGRVCNTDCSFGDFKHTVLDCFPDARVVNCPDDNDSISSVGVVSGFGLKNPDYIDLAFEKNLDVLVSGDLTQQTAILAIDYDLTLIDLGHHESEVPGLFKLGEVIGETGIDCEVIDKIPIEKL